MMKRLAAVLLSLGAVAGCATVPARDVQPAATERAARDGVAVELSIAPLHGGAQPRYGDHVEVRFRITNAETGAELTGLNPIAWLDRAEEASSADACRRKVESFLGGSLQARPEVDLNSYFIVTLNRGGTLSVIDPIRGFGGTKLVTLVPLGGEGAGWALAPDRDTLFVSIPDQNEVVVVDTTSWKVTSRIAVGARPGRLAFQPDGGYVWVATAGLAGERGGVSVIDPAQRREAARIVTTGGARSLAFSSDSRYAFAANEEEGSLSVFDVRALSESQRIRTGSSPVALSYSRLSNAVYVGHADGSVVVIDAARHTVRRSISTAAGLQALGFSPDGRSGFALSGPANLVSVIDSSSDEVVRTITVDDHPDQIAFTEFFAYVRARASEQVTMIRLSTVGRGSEPDVTRFPGGQVAPEFASASALTASISPAPDPRAVLVSNAADRSIYYYMEGMAAPMGNFQNYKREPLGVLAVNRSLRETEPGVYTTTFKLHRGGKFDVPLVVSSPKLTHCFAYTLDAAAPERNAEAKEIRLERLFDTEVAATSPLAVRVRLVDGAGRPLRNVRDLRALAFAAGGFQRRDVLRPAGDGTYEAELKLPSAGVYYIFFESASLGRHYRALPRFIVQATEAAPAGK